MIPYYILIIEDENDRTFMAELYLQYNRLMYSEIYKIIHDPWAAEDLVQTILEKLIGKVQELREKDRERLVNYVITSCRNCARSYLRKQCKHSYVQYDNSWDGEDIEHGRQAIEYRLISNENLATLSRVWPKLDARNRWILESRYIQGKPPDEIARELGIKPDSLRMVLSRARRAAYRLMEDELNTKK